MDGESRRIYETVSGTRPQAEAVLRKRRGAIEAGQYVPRTKETVAEYIDRWFVIYARTNTTPRTQQGYDGYIRNHIKPYLGRIPLQALRTEHVQSLYSVMLERGLSAQTVKHCHRILTGALNQAVDWGNLSRNPAKSASPPPPGRARVEIWSTDTLQRFLDVAKDSSFLSTYRLAIYTAMRRSELCGLMWEDVDLDRAQLRVTRTLQRVTGAGLLEGAPKSEASRRTIHLGPDAIEVLRDTRARQAEAKMSMPAEFWKGRGHVFSGADGSPIDSNRVSRDFASIIRKAGLPSLMIQTGVHPRAMMEIMGHSSITTTMDTYGHLMKGVQAEAVVGIEEQLRGPSPSVGAP